MSVLAPKARVNTFPRPTSPNLSACDMSGQGDCIESSVLARFNILKSRENPKPLNTEEQQRSDSVMARFSILKSREENLKFLNMDEQQQSEIIDGKHTDLIMARFNILKSQEESTKIVEEKPPQAISDEFSGEKYFQPHVRDQSEDEALDVVVSLQPDFQYQAGGLAGGGKFDSYFERAGYESSAEYRGSSVTNDAAVHVMRSGSRTIGENKAGWHGSSSSSEWEHVLKEDFSWKN